MQWLWVLQSRARVVSVWTLRWQRVAQGWRFSTGSVSITFSGRSEWVIGHAYTNVCPELTDPQSGITLNMYT